MRIKKGLIKGQITGFSTIAVNLSTIYVFSGCCLKKKGFGIVH